MLFDFLLAETAAQRGDQEIAVRTYLKLAKTTRDPRVAQRATEIALQSRQAVPALEAAQIWVELQSRFGQCAPDPGRVACKCRQAE